MNPAVIAGAQAAGAVLSFKGQKAAAKSAMQVADYNAKVAENEAILLARAKRRQEEESRMQARQLMGAQRVATAASGVLMSGSPLEAMADAYFGVEKDAARIRYASDIEQLQKEKEAALIRAQGRANESAMQVQAYASLLGGVSGSASTYNKLTG
mgnify:CR=1 FL=1